MAKKAGGRINVSQLTSAISEILDEYETVSQETLNRVIDDTAKETAKQVSSLAPKATGKYASSITWEHVKTTKKGAHVSVVKAEAPEYRLTHLLEKGHAKVGGGRVAPSPAGGHWAPAERSAIADVVVKLKKELGK